MPSRNRIKTYVPEAYYHIYNRGLNKSHIFKDEYDYSVFLNLFKRYLGTVPEKDKSGREYPWYGFRIDLLAFCFMPNHFHMLIYQKDAKAMTGLLRAVSTAYTMYFNKKYGRNGPLFQERYKASLITSDAYLEHISRYIHLNPEDYLQWKFSSLPYYLGQKKSKWLKPEKILELFEGEAYINFLKDYKDHRQALKEIAYELADT